MSRKILSTIIVFTMIFTLLPGLSPVQAAVAPMVAAGEYHTVGLKSDGTVVAVGYNGNGQCNVGSWTDIIQVAAGYSHTVGLKRDGTVVAVGDNYYGQCNVDSWTDITQVATCEYHTVGLKSNGTVVAVGDNDFGQCNVGSWTDIIQVAAGYFHTVGLKRDGTVVAVGYNELHQCNVSSWTDITQVAAGRYHTVGLKRDGTVVAVGYNGNGQCNVGSWTDIIQVAAGGAHTVGLKRDGTVVAVGHNGSGQCNVSLWEDITQVAAGGYHTVGLKPNGTAIAVGENGDGQCDVSLWEDITQVAAGGLRTVGLKSDGTVVVEGNNELGQCNVDSWTDITQVAAGEYHTVGLKSDGTVVAVGYNDFGQCNVDSWTDITQVAAGYYHTVGLKSDGTVVAVGNNNYGQLNVDSWTGITQVAAGDFHTVGLKSNGTVVAMGNNDFGQCNVDSWIGITQVAAGGLRTMGLKSDGTVVAVGYNDDGQCNVDSWTDITQVATCEYHTVGLKSNGTVVAVGKNDYSQCNVDSWTDITQVAAGEYHTAGLKSNGTVVAVGKNDYSQCNVGWNLGVMTSPTVTTNGATTIGTNSATLNMSYTLGDYPSVSVQFAYKKSSDTTWTGTGWEDDPGSPYFKSVSGLDSNTTYDFKAQLKYDTTTIEGSVLQFTTKKVFTITATAGTGGTISPSGEVSVNYGNNQTFTITPDTDYKIKDIKVDGTSLSLTRQEELGPYEYTFTDVTDNHTISAEFASLPVISSSDIQGPYTSNEVQEFSVTTNNPSDGESYAHVLFNYVIKNILLSDIVSFVYYDGTYWQPMPMSQSGTDVIGHYGPPLGFPMPNPYSATTTFRINIKTPKIYQFTITLNDLDAGSVTLTKLESSAQVNPVITSSANVSGTIAPSGTVTVEYGKDQTFTITPNTGYHIKDVLVDGSSVGAVSTYTFTNVTANHTIEATFSDEYTITATCTSGGTISPSGAVIVKQGSDKSFVITANDGYYISDILVDGGSIFAAGGINPSIETISYTYTFTNVQSDHAIRAVFAPGFLYYRITALAGEGGTISPSGEVLVPQFGSKSFTITPNPGYHIYDVLVDGASVGAVSTYTFETVDINHTIEAYFEHNYFKTTYPVGTEVFSPTDTITVTWDVEGFTGTEGKIRVLFFNGSSWQLVASDLDLADGSYDIDLSTKTIVDPLRCRVRAGIYDPTTGAWLTWGTGKQYYDESGHFWIITPSPTQYFKTTAPVGTETFSPTDTITVTWDVEGFMGTEGKVRVLFYNGSSWQLVASDLDLADGSYDIDLSTKTIVDPLRCRVRAGIYDPTTGAWLTWTNGQFYDESGHFWVIEPTIPVG